MASNIFFSHYFVKIKVDSNYSLPIKNIMTVHNVIIHIKSVLNKDENHYYHKIFLEKCSYQLAKKWSQRFVHSIIMVRFGENEIAKTSFMLQKDL